MWTNDYLSLPPNRPPSSRIWPHPCRGSVRVVDVDVAAQERGLLRVVGLELLVPGERGDVTVGHEGVGDRVLHVPEADAARVGAAGGAVGIGVLALEAR